MYNPELLCDWCQQVPLRDTHGVKSGYHSHGLIMCQDCYYKFSCLDPDYVKPQIPEEVYIRVCGQMREELASWRAGAFPSGHPIWERLRNMIRGGLRDQEEIERRLRQFWPGKVREG